MEIVRELRSCIRCVLATGLVMLGTLAYAQGAAGSMKISGKIADLEGNPLAGAGVTEKGTDNTVLTNVDGIYSITAKSSATLLVTFIGHEDKEIQVNDRSWINVVLREEVQELGEVVVTALGIKKKEKSLSYSVQVVGNDEFIRAKDPNMMNTLSGKTAGLVVSRNASGLGGSVKVLIRGNRSASGNNQPLYVIDGMPINNNQIDATNTALGGVNDAANRDGGDGISNLNPDDIESVSVLKGPAAAALYGSQAANGVILITTKKGKPGRTSITFSSNTTFEIAAYGIPEFQNSYTGNSSSWGSPTSVKANYVDDFFQTGVNTINSLALSSGSESRQTYFSYANTYGEGLRPGNKLVKHNFNFRESASFFKSKLVVDANINLLRQKMENRITSGGLYLNPLTSLYRFPRGGSVEGGQTFDYYKDNYEIFNEERNMYVQNWYTDGEDTNQNPYWLINRLPSEDVRTRTIANITFTYKFNPKLTLQARGNADFISDKYQQNMYASVNSTFTGPSDNLPPGQNNGRCIISEGTNLNSYGDVLLTYKDKFAEVFSVQASVGGSITDQLIKTMYLDSKPGGLYYANVFTIENMNTTKFPKSQAESSHRQDQSVFFTAQLGYHEYLFLDVTGRNDWSSTLAFTNSSKTGFFYPSVGLAWIVNESFQLPDFISFGKLRAAWSQVGNALPLYVSNPTNRVLPGGVMQFNTIRPFDELKPERTNSLEFGTEWRMFDSKLEVDVTYYKTNTYNQLFLLEAPPASEYPRYYANAGNIQNQGVEVMLGGTPVSTPDFRWKTNVNFALNRNEVISLHDSLTYFQYGILTTSTNYQMRLEQGGSFGDIYGQTFLRDMNGEIMYDPQGLPKTASADDLVKIANSSPKFTLGWSNTFSYKGLSLYVLIDGRFGGSVLSLTQADLDARGVSKVTGDARNAGGVQFDGRTIDDVQGFYSQVGGLMGITEYYVYDATNIRLRELSLGYAFPRSLFKERWVLKGCSISLVARNLFFFMNNAPYDPDASLSTGNNLQGVDSFGMPTTRSIGFNLKLNF